MLYFVLFNFLLYLEQGWCLWTKGVVHYSVNSKDYDIHSQEIITAALLDVEKELCLKFFDTPPNYSATVDNKILYITNPHKKKTCLPDTYNFTGSVVDMAIGYKCMTVKDVIRITVDMLRASIEQSAAMPANSYDLVKKFQEQEVAPRSTILSPSDRNFINAHYHSECGALSLQHGRRYGMAPMSFVNEYDGVRISPENAMYYANKLWPLGIVMYGVDRQLQNSEEHKQLKYAMTTLELASCVVFQEIEDDGVLLARSLLWFTGDGAESPQQGFVEGNQSISLRAMVEGAPGHTAHALNQLMRVIGMPMQSNRHDRDYYVKVNWDNVQKGKEVFVEKTPAAAWLLDSVYQYDFESVTHAPANYMCRDCSHGETTFEPAQDHLWQRTLTMGHSATLSEADKEMVQVLYNKPCHDRYASHMK